MGESKGQLSFLQRQLVIHYDDEKSFVCPAGKKTAAAKRYVLYFGFPLKQITIMHMFLIEL